MRKTIVSVFALTAVALAPTVWLSNSSGFGWNEAVAASHLAAQSSSAQSVTVKVTPKNLSSEAKTWDFAVFLDTHSVDLNDDLVKTSVLLDGAGARYAPVAWDGAPPGGHRREGVLRFKPIAPAPQSLELQMTRPGESTPRTFRWQLK